MHDTTTAVAAPSPQTRRRLAELAQDKIRLRKEISAANTAIERFRKRNCTTQDGKLVIYAKTASARPALEEEMRQLTADLNRLLGVWHTTLAEQEEINKALETGVE